MKRGKKRCFGRREKDIIYGLFGFEGDVKKRGIKVLLISFSYKNIILFLFVLLM